MSTARTLSLGIALVSTVLACAPQVDLEAERAALRATDEAWAAAASEEADADLIASFWSDDATIYPDGAPTVYGKDAILEMVKSSLELPGFHVTWQPEQVVVAASGDLGWITGTNAFTVPDDEGGTTTVRGRYLTVWRKGADGTWKCVIDMYNRRAPVARAGAP